MKPIMARQTWIRIACVAGAVLMATVLFAGAKVIGKVNSVPTVVHKVEHFAYYGGMAALLAIALGRRPWWIPILFVAVVGALDEWHQLYVAGRNGSPWDWLVDVAGASFAVYVVWRGTAPRAKPVSGT
jgi:VanZ family protein